MCGTLKEKLNAMSKVMRVTNNNSVGEYCAIVELVRDAHVRNLFFFFELFFCATRRRPATSSLAFLSTFSHPNKVVVVVVVVEGCVHVRRRQQFPQRHRASREKLVQYDIWSCIRAFALQAGLKTLDETSSAERGRVFAYSLSSGRVVGLLEP